MELTEAQQKFDEAETVGDKYRVAMDAIDVDADHFYDQEIASVASPREAAEVINKHVGELWMYIVDDETLKKEPEDDEARFRWEREQEALWFPPETRRVMLLPYGRACGHCGGSYALLVAQDIEGNVLKAKELYFG